MSVNEVESMPRATWVRERRNQRLYSSRALSVYAISGLPPWSVPLTRRAVSSHADCSLSSSSSLSSKL